MQDTTGRQKKFIAKTYESPLFDEALGDILRPGGLKLTARVAEIAGISADSNVLDIASGKGTTAFFLSQQYGCRMVGIDLSPKLVSLAQNKAKATGLSRDVEFILGDAESLPFKDSTFNTVISECSFSLLTNKEKAASEFHRVLRPGGKLVITDVILKGHLSQELQTQATFACCIAGAEALEGYIKLLTAVGFEEPYIEDHSVELKKMGYQIIATCGSLEAFSAQLTRDEETCCDLIKGSQATPSEIWKRLFREGKLGYSLLSSTKS